MRYNPLLCIAFFLLLAGTKASAQQLSLGNTPNMMHKSAVLELNASNQGLLFPRLADTTGINNLNPPDGMVIYFTPTKQLLVRAYGYWNPVAASASLNNYWNINGNSNGSLKKFGTTDNYDLSFVTNNAERMRLTTAGYLGIGNANPSSLLHVSGTNPLRLNGVQLGGTTTSDSLLTINSGLVQKLPVATFQPMLNGTGFVKASGSTITYDNNTYTVANAPITGATRTKITYDAKGLVIAGANLAASDIPDLSATYQPLNGSLTSISGLAGTTGYLKKTAANTYVLDNSSFLSTETDPIVKAINGMVKSNGTTISAATAGTDYIAPNAVITGATRTKITYDSKGLVTAGTNLAASDIPDLSATYQPLNGSLTSISGLAGTTGVLRKTAANTYVLDNSSFLTAETDPVVKAINGLVKSNGTTISAATAGTDYVAPNAAITGATKTKITYDSKGLVTAGADATTSDIAEGSNLYYTDTRVRATALTGLSTSTATAVTATDNLLSGIGKLQGQINSINGAGYLTTETDPLAAKKANNLSDLASVSTARTNLGATTVGSNFFTLTNPSAVTFPRINADNSVSALDAATFRSAIGAGTGVGSVTSVSVASANGFAGSVATPTSTPAITLSTTVTGLLKGNAGTGVISAAVAGTDYQAPITLPYTTTRYWNGFGNFVGLNTDSIATGSTNLFTTAAEKSTWNAKEGAIVAPYTANRYWNGYKQFVPLNTDSITQGSNNLFYTDARVRAATLTGLSTATATAVTATDNLLAGIGKLQGQINAINGAGYQTGNQSITWTAGGDASGSASGTTSISPSLTVTGLRGAALPALSTGVLKYTGSAWTFDNSSYLTGNQSITLSGDVTGSGTTAITTAIGANKVTLNHMAQVANGTFLGRTTAGTGNVEALTTAQAKTMLGLGGNNSGDVSLSGQNYLSLSGQTITANAIDLSGTHATGTLAAARFGALTGDVTNAAGSYATTIANGAVTYGKMQNVSATGRLLGRYSAGAGSPEELVIGAGLALTGNTLSATAASNWNMNGNAGVTASQFLGTTDDKALNLKSNNSTYLELARRNTLGLVQGYTDYNDPNEQVLHLRSAVQFYAPAADFYKPKMYVDVNGNFRVKGSSAGTDYFEFGSTGTNNNGGFEFIIGDDGDEPILFKSYHYINGMSEIMRLQSGRMAVGSNSFNATNPEKLLIDAGATNSYNLMTGKGSIDNYLQINVQNRSATGNASSDIVATADNGDESSKYIDMGINSSVYSNSSYPVIGGANNAYLYATGNDFVIGNGTAGKSLRLFTGGFTNANERMRIDEDGNVGIGTTTFDATSPEKLLVDAGTETYTPILAKGNYNGYFQINVKNSSTGSQASSDLVATANNGTETTNFVNLGINGSNFVYTTGNPIETGKANDGYLISAGQDFYVVNNNVSKDIVFMAGGTAPANEAMRITAAEKIGIGTSAPVERFHTLLQTGNTSTLTPVATIETNNTTASANSAPAQLQIMRQVPTYSASTTYAGPGINFGFRTGTGATANSIAQINSQAGSSTSRISFYSRTGTTNGNPNTGTLAENMYLDGTALNVKNLQGGLSNIGVDANGNIIRTLSDGRLKRNVHTLENSLNRVMRLRGVSYNWIDSVKMGSQTDIGFIAQELEKVVPEVVSSGGEYKSVNYPMLTALLAEAMKEQQSEIDNLKKEVAELKEAVKALLNKSASTGKE